MYLSSINNLKLDQIIKSFEVAYRSEIVTALVAKYPNVNAFSIAINSISAKLVDNPIMYGRKFKAKADKIKKEVGSSYSKVMECYNSTLRKDYDNEVPYVSELLDYVSLFFNECFVALADNFQTIEEFNVQSINYHSIRNSLSHPASAKIKNRDAKECIEFVKTLLRNIHDDKFWYISKDEILSFIEEFNASLDTPIIKVHNLDEISFPHGKIVCRDTELNQLREFLFGKERNYRRSGSVVIFGYGGVGKTALALEFVSQILKDIGDKKILSPYDFILFFTSKEEILSFSQTSANVYINNIQKQIGSFAEFEGKINAELKSGDIDNIRESKGLIVIDNFETLPPSDKNRFLEYIRQMPRSIQFILTSRNEEYCEDKINLKEFKDLNKGILFIDQYISANSIKLTAFFSESSKKSLVELSKGNTLIIVLTIQQLVVSDSIGQVLGQLRSVESSNMETIAEFMYKNTIQHTIEDLEKEGRNPVRVLKVLSLYGEAIDLYSISILSGVSVSEVEKICYLFTTRLVLDRIGESYMPNEFANRFVLSKYLPNNVEKKQLSERIRDRKRTIRRQSDDLEESKKRDSGLRKIMEDWKPKHIIDKIAIAESYSIVGRVDDLFRIKNRYNGRFVDEKIQTSLLELANVEKQTSHPYIRMQRGRILMKAYELEESPQKKKSLSEEIAKVYDDAIMSIQYNYSFIINTKSYASINWRYGLIHANILNNYEQAARYIEDAVEVLRRIKVFDKEYYKILNDLSKMYKQLFLKSRDKNYIRELRLIFGEIKSRADTISVQGFDVSRYLREYKKIIDDSFNGNRKNNRFNGRKFDR